MAPSFFYHLKEDLKMKGLLKLFAHGINLVDRIDHAINGRTGSKRLEGYLNRFGKRGQFILSHIYPILGKDTPGVIAPGEDQNV